MHRALLLVHLTLKDKSQNYPCLFFKKFCTQLFIFFCVPSSCFATFFLITQHLFCAFLRLLLPPTQPSASSSSCFFLLLRDLGIRSSSPCDVFFFFVLLLTIVGQNWGKCILLLLCCFIFLSILALDDRYCAL